jgi:hypothetical protein
MIHFKPSFTHHLFDIAIRKLVSTVPTNAQKNYGRLKVAPFERGFILFQEYAYRRVIFDWRADYNSETILATEPRVALRLVEVKGASDTST